MPRSWEYGMGKLPSRFSVLREVIVEHIKWRVPKPVADLHRCVEEDFGNVTERTIYRHLKSLVETGMIKLEPVCDNIDHARDGYVRTELPKYSIGERTYI